MGAHDSLHPLPGGRARRAPARRSPRPSACHPKDWPWRSPQSGRRQDPVRRDPPSGADASGPCRCSGVRFGRRVPPRLAGRLQRPAHGPERHADSLPVPQQFSRDLQVIGLAAKRPPQLGDPLPGFLQLGVMRRLLVRTTQRRLPTLDQPVTPLVVLRLGDLMLTAHIPHRPVTTQTSQHDLGLLLRRPGTPLPLLAHRPHLRESERASSQPSQPGENVNHPAGSASATMASADIRAARALADRSNTPAQNTTTTQQYRARDSEPNRQSRAPDGPHRAARGRPEVGRRRQRPRGTVPQAIS